MSDASLETSVPEIPIAIPICAYRRAGASLTPSPVMATICFFFVKSLTSFLLWRGSALDRTSPLLVSMARSMTSDLSFSLNDSKNYFPVKVLYARSGSFSLTIPMVAAIAVAVSLTSPVIIITKIPAF
jgi:hypothetical protein